ncbi:hypothetical protein B0H15DRAFT_942003 [Mycena belliarum]|uniref:Uncharacterized protein n=1 Tax=Mycena belliarum TaxID=1033014 RepID=A0AAD6XY08_9AGAR|nr:hypothetical protein B0H15DRAFT_942003 [Mycena belliae]
MSSPFSQLGQSSSRPPLSAFRFSDDPPALPGPLVAFGAQTSRPIREFHAPSHASGSVQQQRSASIVRMNEAKAARSLKGPSSQTTDKKHAGNAFASSSSIADPDGPAPDHFRYFICMLPFTLQDDYVQSGIPSPVYKFKTASQLPSLLRALDTANLLASIDLPRNLGLLWPTLDQKVRQHARTYQIIFPGPPDCLAPEDHEHRIWEVCAPRSTRAADNRKFTVDPALERDFKHDWLHKLTSRVRHPDKEEYRLLFTVPRYGNLRAPLPGSPYGEVHSCFPPQVFSAPGDHNLVGLENHDFSCVEGCPDFDNIQTVPDYTGFQMFSGSVPPKRDAPDDQDESNANPFKRHKRSLSVFSICDSEPDEDELPPATYQAITAFESKLPAPKGSSGTYIEIDSSSDDDDGHEDDDDSAPQSRTTDTTLLTNLLAAEARESGAAAALALTPAEILAWRTDICVAMGSENDILPLDVSGPNVQAITDCLLDLIRAIYCPKPAAILDDWTPVDKAVFLEIPVPITGFFHTGRRYNVYGSAEELEFGGANGLGVERAVLLCGLNSRFTDNNRWARTGGLYHRPIFYPDSDLSELERQEAFTVDGAWAAIFLVSLGIGPDPISPFLLIAATQTTREWVGELSLSYIHEIDPSAAAMLAPWWAITHDQVFLFPRDSSHPGLALAIQYLPVPATEFVNPRSKKRHQALHLRLLCNFFFGFQDPWAHPEFLAFVKGFDLRLKGNHTLLSHCKTLQFVQSLLGTVYNRRIKSVEEVVQRLLFRTLDPPDALQDLQYNLLQLRFLRWIRAVGLPRRLVGKFISKEEYRAQRRNPLARAQSFLRSMSGMTMIPPDPHYLLTIFLHRDRSDMQRAFAATPLHFHDCSDEVQVPVNAWTDNILLEPVAFDDLETETEFDVWLSSECSLRSADFNDL